MVEKNFLPPGNHDTPRGRHNGPPLNYHKQRSPRTNQYKYDMCVPIDTSKIGLQRFQYTTQILPGMPSLSPRICQS